MTGKRRTFTGWRGAAFLAAVALVTACFLFADPLLRTSVKRDLAGSVPQTGDATIVTLVTPRSVDMDHQPEPEAVVRFRGRLLPAKHVVLPMDLRVGGGARITYRVGRSGHIYVDSVAPLHGR